MLCGTAMTAWTVVLEASLVYPKQRQCSGGTEGLLDQSPRKVLKVSIRPSSLPLSFSPFHTSATSLIYCTPRPRLSLYPTLHKVTPQRQYSTKHDW